MKAERHEPEQHSVMEQQIDSEMSNKYGASDDMAVTLPSSPPALPELLSPSPPSYRPRNRKRRLSESAGLSSDPLFSEDISEVELDDAIHPKRKRLIRGPWWTLSRRKSSTRNLRYELGRTGLRVADSGVWMPSDDSEHEKASIDISSDFEVPEDIQYRAINLKSPTEHGDDTQAIANKIIQAALEQGKESIDLSGLKLRIVSNAMIHPLHQLVRQPQDHSPYRPLIPELQLYLQGNELTTLPTELFRFTNITVLSLRNNRLSSLPAALFRMPQLGELNVSGNELNYLPWEALLQMHKSVAYKMICAPNPFCTLTSEETPNESSRARYDPTIAAVQKVRKGDQLAACFVAASQVEYYNNHGTLTQTPRAEAMNRATSGTSTLFEYALKRAQKANALSDAIAMLPHYVPRGIINALNEATFGSEVGNERCSVCSKEMVIARAQWTEYWSDLSSTSKDLNNSCLPYMRKVCSYACATPSEIGAYIVSGLGLRTASLDNADHID